MKFYYSPRVYTNGFLVDHRIADGTPTHQGERYMGRKARKATRDRLTRSRPNRKHDRRDWMPAGVSQKPKRGPAVRERARRLGA